MFLKYKKCEKLTFEISIRVKKLQIKIFEKCMLLPEELQFIFWVQAKGRSELRKNSPKKKNKKKMKN